MLKTIVKYTPKLFRTPLHDVSVTKGSLDIRNGKNIRHIKGEKDAQRALIFTKIGRQIKVAIQEGGSADPKLNAKLAQAVDQAKRVNMPLATLQNIIKTSQNDKTKSVVQLFDFKGPSGSFFLCEIFASQPHAIKQNIATILRKHTCKYCDGAALHQFDEKGIIEAEPLEKKSDADPLETATDHAIESGAEDVKLFDENTLQFICGKTNLNSVVGNLEKFGYKVTSASVEFVPLHFVTLNDSELELCKSLYEKLEAIPEVTRLADNIA